ncbi:MAG: phosphoribosylformylglycinamidine synthase [Candidatus Hydrogenedentes bacterium]|nr:phosphoribosylformylglycinamidine synthase [Candidatus Hydrogenedentota bacterium]
MANRIEVAMQPGRPDPAGEAVRHTLAEDLHIAAGSVRVINIYTVHAALSSDELERVRAELFTDPIIETSAINQSLARDFDFVVEVGFRPGVTDNVGKSALEGIQDTIGRRLPAGAAVFKSKQYVFKGIAEADCLRATKRCLANDLIERWVMKSAAEMAAQGDAPLLDLPIVTEQSDPEVHPINLEISDDALIVLSRDMMLALDLREMQAIQAHYRDPETRARRAAAGLPENPTDIELEILAQTWSEHCKHKIFAADVDYTDADGNTRRINGLFRNYVKATTDIVGEKVDWLVSVFHDNAGVIKFTDDYHFALKAETHNSPSALDPYGGAMTGIVGVNRDILGAGQGCRCIFNTDVFCFASPDFDGEIPERLLHPRRVLRGVHRGVKDGGNESGIPTVNGAIVFHERFLGKPLVFCGTGGLIPVTVNGQPSEEKGARPGDRILMAGGRIGKDGIHGATFSSEELHEGSPATAVQIGDPITQKKMADFLMEARDLGLYTCVTDNGAGGLSSSIGEMAEKPGGATVYLDKCPLKYAGLAPWEIFLSEAQERMSLAVPPENVAALLDLARRREVEVTDIGEFNDSGRLEAFYGEELIGSLQMDFLHDGVPRMRLPAKLDPIALTPPTLEPKSDLTADLKAVLGALNVASKESFVRMYDHEVQGASVLKPFQGADHDGPGNAAVLRPDPNSPRGIAVACGITPKYADLDAYHMMACAIDEAVRNLVATGARMGTIAGLDNFCWPDPVQSEKTPDGAHKMAQLVRCCEALKETCVAYDIPLISGKDSMKNDYKIGDTKISIPPTVLFTAAAILDDATRVVSMDAKRAGDAVYVLGETRNELGGSEYLALSGQLGDNVPVVDPARARARYEALHRVIAGGLVASCHDCSDGGLGAALAEVAFAGGFGMDLNLAPLGVGDDIVALFSESQSRFVATASPEHAAAFEALMDATGCYRLGEVTTGGRFVVRSAAGTIVDAPIAELKEAWQAPLRY